MNCPHCGLIHETTCSLIKAIEYHPDGTVKRVEFKTASDYMMPQMPASPLWPQPNPAYPGGPLQPWCGPAIAYTGGVQ